MTSYKEYLQTVDHTYNTFGWRYGQTIMNVLHAIYPQKYNELVMTENDCYYDDNKVPNTLKLIEEWTTNATMQKTTLQ